MSKKTDIVTEKQIFASKQPDRGAVALRTEDENWMADKGRETIARLAQAVIDLSAALQEQGAALQGVLDLIETGVLVRDISKDHETGWAMQQILLVKTLARAKSALDGKDLGGLVKGRA